MSQHRRHRKDQNQKAIVEALENVGADTFDLSQVGKGLTDILVGFRGVNFLLEIKNPDQNWKFTEKQNEFHRFWRGQKAVVETVDDALKAIGAMS